jgi:pseudouridine kinase
MRYPDFSPAPDAPVLVIGAAGYDVVGRLEADIKSGTSTAAEIRSSFGGVARNIAENLARLGHPSILLTAVGYDETGERMLQQVRYAGVNVDSVLRCDEHATGAYLAVVDQQGELVFALDDMHALQALTPEYIRSQESCFRNAAAVFVDMNLQPKTLRTVLSLARRARLPVCGDPTSLGLAKRMKAHLPRFRLITPNAAEAALLAETQLDASDQQGAVEVASRLVSLGVENVIITMAELGVCYASPVARGSIPAIQTEIVDPTGAGDALTAAVIFGLLNDMPLDEAIRLGASSAALTLRYRGAVRPDLTLENLYNNLVI